MSTVTIVLLVILAVLIVGVVVLYFLGKKAQKKQAEQQEQIEAYKQTVSMLIIDKKRMKLKDAGLPRSRHRTDSKAAAWFQASHRKSEGWPSGYDACL